MEKKMLISNKEIIEKVKELGQRISNDYKDERITLVCILKGSLYFFADLSKEIDLDAKLEFIRVASYEGQKSTGNIELKLDLDESLKDKNVIIVEDIVDTGRTMSYLINHFQEQKPKSLKICSLLDKPDKRIVKGLKVDYVGFTIPDYYVFGYGLDLNQKYRNLPDIYYVIKKN